MTAITALWSGAAITILITIALMLSVLYRNFKVWKPFRIVPFHEKLKTFHFFKVLRLSSWLAFRIALIYWAVVGLSWGFWAEFDRLNIRIIHIVAGIGVLVIGMGAFLFKKRSRKWYGVVEVAFAWFTAVSITTKMAPGRVDLPTWVGLAGTAYVVSRGLENIENGTDDLGKAATSD